MFSKSTSYSDRGVLALDLLVVSIPMPANPDSRTVQPFPVPRPVRLPTGRDARGTTGEPPRAGHGESRSASGAPATVPLAREPEAPRRPASARLGAILLERDVITSDQLDAALERQKRTRRRIGLLLIDMGVTTQDAVLGALQVQLGLPTASINAYTVDRDAIKALNEKVARRHGAFPLQKVGTTLSVAVAAPLNLAALDDLRFASGCEVHMVLALEDEIQAALDRYYQSDCLPYQLETAQDPVTVESFIDRRDPGRG